VPVRLLYLIMFTVFGWLALLGRSQASEEADLGKHELPAGQAGETLDAENIAADYAAGVLTLTIGRRSTSPAMAMEPSAVPSSEQEKKTLVADLGEHRAMILRNHGLLEPAVVVPGHGEVTDVSLIRDVRVVVEEVLDGNVERLQPWRHRSKRMATSGRLGCWRPWPASGARQPGRQVASTPGKACRPLSA
jgi:hypothetical protein